MDVITYKPQTKALIQKIEEDERREEMQDEAAQKKDTRQKTKKVTAKTEQPTDEDVYIDREGKFIRRGEERQEMRDRRQDVRREYRYHRR